MYIAKCHILNLYLSTEIKLSSSLFSSNTLVHAPHSSTHSHWALPIKNTGAAGGRGLGNPTLLVHTNPLSFPKPNQLLFVLKPNQTLALSHHKIYLFPSYYWKLTVLKDTDKKHRQIRKLFYVPFWCAWMYFVMKFGGLV